MASSAKSDYRHLTHEFGPFFSATSEILILGSFPSVKSREAQFYYGHPMNRFWKVLEAVYGVSFPRDIDGKKRILDDIHIALYDVIDSCDIIGSSDASIKNAIPTDILSIIRKTRIKIVLLNGAKAGNLFLKYHLSFLDQNIEYAILPSTSPANAACSFDMLVRKWKELLLKP